MLNKVMLYILPMVLILFSCVLALPEEEVTEPVAFVTEPTPVPLEQSTPTTAFDVPDTPVPTTTPIPSTTPTTAVVSPTDEDSEKTSYVLLYSETQIWEGQPRRVDLPYKTLSLEQDAFRGTTISGDPTPIDFGLEADASVRSVSPNGRYVLLGTTPQMEGSIPYLYDQQTKNVRPLLADLGYPAVGHPKDWSVDSQKLLYDAGHLWVIDMITGEENLLVRGTGFDAHFSPSGDYVAFIARAIDLLRMGEVDETSLFGITESERNDYFLWIVESTGGTPRRILAYENALVGWSSEGLLINHFPYAPDDAPKKNNVPPPPLPNVGPLWTIDLNGQRRHNFVSSSDFWRVYGRLSPDRTKLAFTKLEGEAADCSQIEDYLAKIRCEDSGYSLYVIDLRQDEIIKIGSSNSWLPAWSPDSKQLGFTSYQNEQPEIWTAQADGSEVRLIRTSNKDHYLGSIFWLRQ